MIRIDAKGMWMENGYNPKELDMVSSCPANIEINDVLTIYIYVYSFITLNKGGMQNIIWVKLFRGEKFE